MRGNEVEISASDLPFDVTELGVFHTAWEACPGVYYVSVERTHRPMATEFYVVMPGASMISSAARAYGQPYPGRPDVLMFDLQADRGGWHVLDYEIGKYKVAQQIPIPEGDSFANIVAYGRELYPEYFGTHPVPGSTPWGPSLRYKSVDNGIVWIETETDGWVLVVSFPVYEDLSDGAKKQAAVWEAEPSPAQKNKADCLFFTWQSACIPIFELMKFRPEWTENHIIDRAALMNAIWEYHPKYAMAYNAQEQAGLNDALGLIVNALGVDWELTGSEKNMIAVTTGAGTDYYSHSNLCFLLEKGEML